VVRKRETTTCMFLTAERKFQKLNRNPDCVTDPPP
jgi:hypothetical protein